MSLTKHILCPSCGKTDTWQKNNLYRPFCSERCRIIDLGEWASENYKIPTKDQSVDFSDSENDVTPEIKNQ